MAFFCVIFYRKDDNAAMKKKTDRITLHKKIWCKIRYYQQLNNIDNETLAIALNVHERTLREYDKNAANVTMGQIDSFLFVNNITLDDLLNA